MYRGIDLGEAISISGSKAMADKIMADKKADKASRERSRSYTEVNLNAMFACATDDFCRQSLALHISKHWHINCRWSKSGDYPTRYVCMIRPWAFEVTQNLLKWVIFPYPWPLSHMLCRVLVKYKYIPTHMSSRCLKSSCEKLAITLCTCGPQSDLHF